MPDFIIRDFQSIKEAKISVKGFTLLIGESSAGKSACLRAIQAATTNRFKSGQIRNGCDHIMVKVRYEDKEDVLQVRRNETGSPIAMLGKTMFSKMKIGRAHV